MNDRSGERHCRMCDDHRAKRDEICFALGAFEQSLKLIRDASTLESAKEIARSALTRFA